MEIKVKLTDKELKEKIIKLGITSNVTPLMLKQIKSKVKEQIIPGGDALKNIDLSFNEWIDCKIQRAVDEILQKGRNK